MAEVLSYLHVRLRKVIDSVELRNGQPQVTLNAIQWQAVLDLQAKIAEYLRRIGLPD